MKKIGLIVLLIILGVAQKGVSMYPPQNIAVQQNTKRLWELVGRAHQDNLRISEVESFVASAQQAIDAGANINAIDQSEGDTPLMRLTYKKTPLALEFAKLLIDKKADLRQKNSMPGITQGWTALDYTVFNNNFELADLLLKAGAPRELSPSIRTPGGTDTLLFVQGKKPLDQIRKEIYGPDYQNQPSLATKKLFELANEGYLRQRTPLEKAKKDIQTLLDQGADLKENRLSEDSFLTTVITYGASYPQLRELVDYLTAKGADVNQPSVFTPLMAAVTSENSELVRLLIEKGVDRSKKHPRMGWTAYDLAVMLPERKAKLAGVLDLLDPKKQLPAAAAPVRLTPKTVPAPARDLRNVPAAPSPADQARDIRRMNK